MKIGDGLIHPPDVRQHAMLFQQVRFHSEAEHSRGSEQLRIEANFLQEMLVSTSFCLSTTPGCDTFSNALIPIENPVDVSFNSKLQQSKNNPGLNIDLNNRQTETLKVRSAQSYSR